jgi:hypothetical protein
MMHWLFDGEKEMIYVYTAGDERLWELNLVTYDSQYSIRDLDGKVDVAGKVRVRARKVT